MFNLRVPLEARDDVFLMNTLTDAQLIVSSDVAALLDRCTDGADPGDFDDEAREALGAQPEIDCFLLDDGFQHRSVFRDFDLVLINKDGERVPIVDPCDATCQLCPGEGSEYSYG